MDAMLTYIKKDSPILAPGELITKETIDYIEYSKKKGSLVTGPEDMEIEYINVLDC